MRRFYIYILALFALCSCLGGDEEYNTLLVVRPTHQVESSSPNEWLEGCVAYVFEGVSVEDIDLWSVESYDDALNGVMTNVQSGEKITATAKGVDYTFPEIDPEDLPESYDPEYDPEAEDNRVYEYGVGALSMQIGGEDIALLVVDPSTESYGYTALEVGMNLSVTYVSVLFHDWKYGSYASGKWKFQSPAAPVVDDTTIVE